MDGKRVLITTTAAWQVIVGRLQSDEQRLSVNLGIRFYRESFPEQGKRISIHRDGGESVRFVVLANSKLTGLTAVSYFFTLTRDEPKKGRYEYRPKRVYCRSDQKRSLRNRYRAPGRGGGRQRRLPGTDGTCWHSVPVSSGHLPERDCRHRCAWSVHPPRCSRPDGPGSGNPDVQQRALRLAGTCRLPGFQSGARGEYPVSRSRPPADRDRSQAIPTDDYRAG